MAKYRVLHRCLIDNNLYEPGVEVEVQDDFVPGRHLEPLDRAAKSAFSKYEADRGDKLTPRDGGYVKRLVDGSLSDKKEDQPRAPSADALGVRGVVKPAEKPE
jgi:hypothetical protein